MRVRTSRATPPGYLAEVIPEPAAPEANRQPVARPAAVGGGVLAALTRGLAGLRPSRKPLHPEGVVSRGTLVRTGGAARSGVEWLDDPGVDEVLVRVSRAIGLPRWLPDIHGLAVRVPHGPSYGDLLLASTGTGRLARFVLTAGRDVTARPLTTLLPYRGPDGPLLIAALASVTPPVLDGPRLSFDLMWARGLDPWVPFARLEVEEGPSEDASVSFDPVLHPLPGLPLSPWVRRLREPAYGVARAGRR